MTHGIYYVYNNIYGTYNTMIIILCSGDEDASLSLEDFTCLGESDWRRTKQKTSKGNNVRLGFTPQLSK